MSETRSRRRSLQEWKKLVSAQQQSSLSCAAFCQSEGIAYQSFMNRRKKLSGTSGDDEQINSQPAFVEIAASNDREAGPVSNWLIELDIATGVQLRIAR